MIVKSTKEVACKACGEIVLINEYKGLEGGFYHSHFCPKFTVWMLANPNDDLFIEAVPA